MNQQMIAIKLVQNFRQNGLTRNHPSFFGQAVSSQPLFKSATPQDAMLRALRAADLTVAEPTFFGLPRRGYVTQSAIGLQLNAMRAQEPRTFVLPNRSHRAA